MRRRVAVVVLSVLAVACGGSEAPDAAPAPTLAPTPAPATDVVPTVSAQPTTPAPATPPSPIDPPTPSTASAPTVEPREPVDDWVVLGPPDPALIPEALPPTALDWAAVGAGWLLIDHGPWFGEPGVRDQRGIYLVAPDDVVYGVSALAVDGGWYGDVSADGRRVLLQQYDDACAEGCSCPGATQGSLDPGVPDDSAVHQQVYGFSLLDLTTASLRPVIDPVSLSVCDQGRLHREVEFADDGAGIWVTESWFGDGYRLERVRLGRVEIESGDWTTIVDEPVEVREGHSRTTATISIVDLGDGRMAVGTPAGVRVLAVDGSQIRELAVPHPACELERLWDADHLLARCPASASDVPIRPDVPVEQCYSSGLWLVAIDGASADELAVPLDADGYVACWSGYAIAAQIGDELAVGVGGDGCSDDVVLITADGTATQWLPDDLAESCTEMLLGVRNGAWLLSAHSEFDGGGTYEVTAAGATRLDVPSGLIVVL